MRFVFTFVLKDIQRLCTRFNPERHEMGSALTAEDSILWHSLCFSTILQWETDMAVNSSDTSYLNKSMRQTGCYPTLDSHTPTFVGHAEAGEEIWNHWNYSCVDNEKSLQMVGWINNLYEQPFFSSTGYAKCSAGWILQASWMLCFSLYVTMWCYLKSSRHMLARIAANGTALRKKKSWTELWERDKKEDNFLVYSNPNCLAIQEYGTETILMLVILQ